MNTSSFVWVIIIILILGGGGWYYMSMQTAPAMDSSAAGGTVLEGSGAVVGAADEPISGGTQLPMEDGAEGSVIGANLALGTNSSTALGTYLVAYNGMTLYTFTKDTGSESTCYDTCAVNWPPYVVGAEDNVHNVKAGVGGKVDSIVRKDGSAQVTYNGHPLYFWKNDAKAGDTTGHKVNDVWFVVKP